MSQLSALGKTTNARKGRKFILDPFIESGQTVLAQLKTKPHRLGYDISGEYLGLGGRQIRSFACVKGTVALLDLIVKEDKANE